MVQLLIRGAAQGTTCVTVAARCEVKDVKERIQELTGIPVAYQGLVYGGRQLHDGAPLFAYNIQSGSTLQLVYRLLGGKGGFGALLRGQGRDGKITENFDACRDLSGRRVRHQSAQQKLSQWKEEGKQRDLERLAMQHIKEQAKKAKRDEQEQVDVASIREAQEEAITRTQQAVQDALHTLLGSSSGKGAQGAAGSSSSGSGTSAATATEAKAEGSGSLAGGSGSSTAAGVKRKEDPAAGVAKPGARPAKKPKMLAMLEEVTSSSSDDEDE